jgi:hypothetical protein
MILKCFNEEHITEEVKYRIDRSKISSSFHHAVSQGLGYKIFQKIPEISKDSKSYLEDFLRDREIFMPVNKSQSNFYLGIVKF